jgi:2-oxoglutarate ferredoxin oxidoreductase subunit alpha
MAEKEVKKLEEVTVRFAGDSGDGMQLTGSRFSDATAFAGNDLSTLPDYPSEIRAPAGTLSGVSGFQLHFSSTDIETPGDQPDVLVAMNPAALKVNLHVLKQGATIIVNSSAFDEKNLKLAKYDSNPLEDGSLEGYNVIEVPMTKLTVDSLKEIDISNKDKHRCKNFFALGLMFWLYSRKLETTIDWIKNKFKKNPNLVEANIKALKAGHHYGELKEIFTTRYYIEKAKLPPGTYRNVSGNQATALGFIAASYKSKLPLFLGSYPITPASEILQELSKFKRFGVKTLQAEDEIASVCATIGAAYTGQLAITTTSGPGLALKSEAIGLGVITELPMVIVDVQRGGPSTGLPTKTEQSDLLQAICGRHGESPVCVIAAQTPADCFWMAIEASRIAIKYMTPVILMTDGYLANGSEPFRIPAEEELEDIPVKFAVKKDGEEFYPYSRDINLARPWAIPGTPGLEHRIGGLEKSHIYGNVSHDPQNHEFMVRLRDEKIKNIANDVPDLEVVGDEDADLLIVGWGSTYGAITEAIAHLKKRDYKLAHAHFKYINPMPKNTAEVLKRYKKILVPEVNLGQLSSLLRDRYFVDAIKFNKIQGLPLFAGDIEEQIEKILGGDK